MKDFFFPKSNFDVNTTLSPRVPGAFLYIVHKNINIRTIKKSKACDLGFPVSDFGNTKLKCRAARR
jgi:hypothetical protein